MDPKLKKPNDESSAEEKSQLTVVDKLFFNRNNLI